MHYICCVRRSLLCRGPFFDLWQSACPSGSYRYLNREKFPNTYLSPATSLNPKNLKPSTLNGTFHFLFYFHNTSPIYPQGQRLSLPANSLNPAALQALNPQTVQAPNPQNLKALTSKPKACKASRYKEDAIMELMLIYPDLDENSAALRGPGLL